MEEPSRIDDQIDQLTAGIVQRTKFARPEIAERLSPERVRVIKGIPGGIHSFCVATPNEVVILMGAELYPLFLQYTSAVATFMLPSEPGGPRPSHLWPPARDALATTLDWISSPAPAPMFHDTALSANQSHAATAFAVYLYRFELCRHLAHVMADHIAALAGRDPRAVSVLLSTQEQEVLADTMALNLQVRSLPDPSQLVNALASSAYHISVTAAVDSSRGLRISRGDSPGWPAYLPRPPDPTVRATACNAIADSLHPSAGQGLESVQDGLAEVNDAVLEQAYRSRDHTRAAVGRLVHTVEPDDDSGVTAARASMLKQLDHSPQGVLLALQDGRSGDGQTADIHPDDRSRCDALLADLPDSASFLRLTKAELARHYSLH